MQSAQQRIRWSTICLWLLTAAVAVLAAMNWRERARRQYDIDDGLPQLLRSTFFLDSRGELRCGDGPVPVGLAFGYKGMDPGGGMHGEPRLCDVTTVCLRPAAWNIPGAAAERTAMLAWLAQRKTLSKVRVSYHGVTADDLAQLGQLPALTSLRLDHVPRTDDIWTAVGRLEQLDQLSIGLPAELPSNLAADERDWASDDPIAEAVGQIENGTPAELGPQTTDDSTADDPDRPARIGRREFVLMGGLPRIRRLELSYLAIDDDSLPQLKSLETLKLSNCQIGRQTYDSLADCPQLRELVIKDMPPGEFAAARVAAIPALRILKINCPIKDEELQALCASRTLSSLELTNVSQLSEQSLSRLSAVAIERLKIRIWPTDSVWEILADLQPIATLRDLHLDLVMPVKSPPRGQPRLEQVRDLTIEGVPLTNQEIQAIGPIVPRATLHVHTTYSGPMDFSPEDTQGAFDSLADSEDDDTE